MRQDLRVNDVARVVAWILPRVFCNGGVRHDGKAGLRRHPHAAHGDVELPKPAGSQATGVKKALDVGRSITSLTLPH